MSRYTTLQNLTEGITDRNVGNESSRLQEKWARIGFLCGF